jgi:hypothetical protein
VPEPEMQMVSSSNVEAVGYDSDARELYIRFTDGDTYAYSNVEPQIYEGILQAPSVGSYFNREIKPFHEHRKV